MAYREGKMLGTLNIRPILTNNLMSCLPVWNTTFQFIRPNLPYYSYPIVKPYVGDAQFLYVTFHPGKQEEILTTAMIHVYQVYLYLGIVIQSNLTLYKMY